jgi:hypothetical protein
MWAQALEVQSLYQEEILHVFLPLHKLLVIIQSRVGQYLASIVKQFALLGRSHSLDRELSVHDHHDYNPAPIWMVYYEPTTSGARFDP